jgi:hypothetical protein
MKYKRDISSPRGISNVMCKSTILLNKKIAPRSDFAILSVFNITSFEF